MKFGVASTLQSGLQDLIEIKTNVSRFALPRSYSFRFWEVQQGLATMLQEYTMSMRENEPTPKLTNSVVAHGFSWLNVIATKRT